MCVQTGSQLKILNGPARERHVQEAALQCPAGSLLRGARPPAGDAGGATSAETCGLLVSVMHFAQ